MSARAVQRADCVSAYTLRLMLLFALCMLGIAASSVYSIEGDCRWGGLTVLATAMGIMWSVSPLVGFVKFYYHYYAEEEQHADCSRRLEELIGSDDRAAHHASAVARSMGWATINQTMGIGFRIDLFRARWQEFTREHGLEDGEDHEWEVLDNFGEFCFNVDPLARHDNEAVNGGSASRSASELEPLPV